MINTENAEHYIWGDHCDGWHLLTSPGLSVIQERVPAGASERSHFHKQAQQFFYVLSGYASLDIDGKLYQLAPRQGIAVAAGIPHRLFNDSAQDLEFLVVSSPHSHGDRVDVS